MRGLFGIVGLLLVVLVVSLLVRRQLQDAGPQAGSLAPAAQEARQIQEVQRSLDAAAAEARRRVDAAEKAE
jgi:uncharacterized membrane protein